MLGKESRFLKLLLCCWLPLITGCAATRYIAFPTSPPPDLTLQASTRDIEIRLHYVIVPDGPGSWVQGARWNEWVISVRNLTNADVAIQGIALVDPRGAYVPSGYISPQQIESESERLAKTYGPFILQSAAAPAIGEAVAQAGMATGSLVPYYGVNFLLMAAPHIQSYLEAKDREAIETEFARRRLPSPLRLSGTGFVQGSVFFPLIPQPKALVIGYRTQTGGELIALQLEKLSKTAVSGTAAAMGQDP